MLRAGLTVGRRGGCIIRDTASSRRRVPVLRALVRPIQRIFYFSSVKLTKIHQARYIKQLDASRTWVGSARRKSNLRSRNWCFLKIKTFKHKTRLEFFRSWVDEQRGVHGWKTVVSIICEYRTNINNTYCTRTWYAISSYRITRTTYVYNILYRWKMI